MPETSDASKPRPIRVMSVDDHDMVRRGLAVFLEAIDDFEMVGEAASGSEALDLLNTAQPDVVLMDLVMPDMDGITAIRLIRQTHPEIQVIALTSFKEESFVQAALQAGAIGYLLKNASIDELAQAIRAAAVGKPTLSPEATQALIHMATHSTVHDYKLTDREREVLTLMVAGQTNQQIARQLTLSLSTIKFHVSNILSKLSVESRTEAVAVALQHHLVN